MYPIDTYRVTPDLFGRTRYQAEADPYPLRFCRRAYSEDAARRKLARDLDAHFAGRASVMQKFLLPVLVPVRRRVDRLARRLEQRRKRQTLAQMEKNR